ncbi:MAG: ATP-binding cassette domain-containing protein [Candidatus Symbiothrix sp.]|jgi:ABC-2 type transport system ATP-binding protein|nr:ATP-binding cassette domain-containing protein [Candidatus Symbiothrix sp.]
MTVLETKDVVKQYAGHLALDKVNIRVPAGQVFGLLGPNGAGKTTLLRIINHITAPDAGEVLFNNRPSQADDIYRIGYLPEERGLYRKMKAGEQAVYIARLKGLTAAEAEKRLKRRFAKFDLTDWWNRRVEELSKGMQQKVQFIITLVHEPELLIFDEPFSGFDPLNAELLKNEILDLKQQGKTIIFSTHNMASVEELCDGIALIDHSQVVLQGELNDIRQKFKTNVYRIKTPQTHLQVADRIGTVISEESRAEQQLFLVAKNAAVSGRDFLSELIRENDITAFEEEIPSMNDIFIQLTNKQIR